MESNTEVRPATYIHHVRIIIIYGRILREVRTIDSTLVDTELTYVTDLRDCLLNSNRDVPNWRFYQGSRVTGKIIGSQKW